MPSANLTPGSVHVNAPLSNYARGYGFPNMVAERVLPVLPVQKEADVYYIFNKEELQEQDDLRADGDEANEMTWDVTSTAYLAEEYALRKIVTDRVIRNADAPIRPKMTTVMKLKRALMIEQERRIQALVQSASTITNTGSPTAQWDATSGQDPEADVDAAKNSVRINSGMIPNAMLLAYDVAQSLKQWLRATAWTTYGEYLSKGDLPPMLWGLETIVAGAVRNTANAAATESLADIWNDNVLIFHKDPTPDLMSPNLGWIIRAQDWTTIQYRQDSRKGEWQEVSVIEDEVVAYAAAGYLITDVLASR